MLTPLILIIYAIITDIESLFYYFNQALVFMGLGISFATLQDTTTTQNEISKHVWENPSSGKRVILITAVSTFFIIVLGITGILSPVESILRQISIGLIAMGIGLIGMLKGMIEMFEHHRPDKMTD